MASATPIKSPGSKTIDVPACPPQDLTPRQAEILTFIFESTRRNGY